MNGIAPGRSLARILGATFLLLQLAVAAVAHAAPPVQANPGRSRPAQFKVVKQYVDGPWLVPTLRAVHGPSDWKSAMDDWSTKQQICGPTDPPEIDWNHQALVVLSLGAQFAQTGMVVNDCQVAADMTVLDLHFVLPEHWDPNGEYDHPAVLVAVDRADLKNLELRFDCTIPDLPTGFGRRDSSLRPNAAAPATEVAPAPGESQALLLDAKTTWGRVKAGYRQ